MALTGRVRAILTLASLITALALSGEASSYLRDTISDRMSDYAQDDDAIAIIDRIQLKYECCGLNLWLDWSRVALGVSANGISKHVHD